MSTIKVIGIGAGVIAGVWALSYGLTWAGLIGARPVAKYAEETRAQAYDTSRQYQQGINRDIARYCREYDAADDTGKRAVGDLILTTTDTYQGELTPSNQACVARILEN